MELFVAGLVLGVLLALCASGRGDARMVHGHQPKVPPADWVDWAHVERPPGSAAMPPQRKFRIGTGAKGTQPVGHVNPLPPRPTPPPPRRPPPPDPGLISYDDRPREVR
jgi:hypothetical protein